jgi:hypothetical protein
MLQRGMGDKLLKQVLGENMLVLRYLGKTK